jgi:hypothetical protein
MSEKKWHAGRMIFALARHFNWWQQTMLTEFEVDGGRADLVIISRSNYLTEVEVKISLSDWNADQHKRKFCGVRPHVSRFFYAIPETLKDKVPDWVPPEAGILVLYDMGHGFDRVSELRAAKRLNKLKVDDKTIRKMHESCYYRFWRQNMEVMRGRLHD